MIWQAELFHHPLRRHIALQMAVSLEVEILSKENTHVLIPPLVPLSNVCRKLMVTGVSERT